MTAMAIIIMALLSVVLWQGLDNRRDKRRAWTQLRTLLETGNQLYFQLKPCFLTCAPTIHPECVRPLRRGRASGSDT